MEGEIFIYLIIGVVFGAVCAAVANSKGRNAVAWFFLGFLIGWIAIVIVAVLPNLKTQQEKARYQDRENRRLREQLRQERMKSESFRQHAQSRLDVHDQHLGVDTRNAGYQLADNADSPPAQLESPQQSTVDWYYELNGESVGPMALEELARLAGDGRVQPRTLVWAEHLGDWTEADRVPGLSEHLRPPDEGMDRR